MARLSIRGVSKQFQSRTGEVAALENVSLEVNKGEFVVLVGPSGCGKSTLLYIVAGLEKPDAGDVWEEDKPVRGPGPDRSLVFQDGALFPWLSAQKNVEFPLRRLGFGRKEREERAERCLRMVHLTQFAHSSIHELSGGMRQRVAIARAIAVEPQVLLMDEPFAALDALTREDLYVELQDVCRTLGTTVLFVTHNVREAVTLGDRVVLLSRRPGRIQEVFEVEIPRPRHIDDVEVSQLAHQISHSLKLGVDESADPVERESRIPALGVVEI